LRVRGTLQEFPLASFSQEFVAFYDNSTPGQDRDRHACHLDALEHRVIHAHVMRFRADRVLPRGVEDDKISVAANGNRSFARIETE
jgi:hypothetical protein